ncbi:hypothetical protein LOTGIDRAFT_237258 [Lottia gigantea]|uniref:U2A'/phosphoprotein 32 family A C-terminal domain-containing protein n=1 Tax=Lottia gigantea TaxID=225164 RepID=V4BAZ6_LOTGI|nr:hypothetical protein LOTGIDRAFT_237258 [Lottia gigantea]ESP04711.1 hypothetical protein LOTGIDRAFT_237258 [Lottia gigantea]
MASNSSEEVITELLDQQSIKKDKDVEELYLAKRNLTEVCDLRQFRFLKYLWLNGNKLRRISCLEGNCRLVELYLQNNQLVSIDGALRHLTCLKLLFLHNNQLRKLDLVLNELKKMTCLDTLSLFDNPLSQEPDYRIHVLNSIKSLQILDRQEVSKSERDVTKKIYQQEAEHISQTIAFGRRTQGPPKLYHVFTDSQNKTTKFEIDEFDDMVASGEGITFLSDNNEELLNRLRVILAAMKEGHRSHRQYHEVNCILKRLLEKGIIDKNDYKSVIKDVK